jgi:hypothetical protein
VPNLPSSSRGRASLMFPRVSDIIAIADGSRVSASVQLRVESVPITTIYLHYYLSHTTYPYTYKQSYIMSAGRLWPALLASGVGELL